MKPRIKFPSLYGVLAFLILVCLVSGSAYAETTELKLSHFGSPSWFLQKKVAEPWAKKIEQLSAGKVKFTFFPNQILGKAPEQYDLAVKGTADISMGITEYTPGRFPLASVMKLPFMRESGEKASMVFWHLYQKFLANEFKDTKVLWLWCCGPDQIHTIGKPVKTLKDLKGLRIKTADLVLADALKLMGAEPVICTITEAQTLLKEGKLDGVGLPWEGAMTFGFLDRCRYHTEIDMFTIPFFAVMNKEKYGSFPAELRKIIDDNSGERMAVAAGRESDIADAQARTMAQERGDFIYPLPKAELARWKKLALPVGDQWVEGMKARGLPGLEVLTYVVDLFIQIQR
jgi:TRAP-type transport system periplasmic protein